MPRLIEIIIVCEDESHVIQRDFDEQLERFKDRRDIMAVMVSETLTPGEFERYLLDKDN